MSGQAPSSGSQPQNALAFRPKDPNANTAAENEWRFKPNSMTLTFRPKSETLAGDRKDGNTGSQGKSTPDGKKMSDEDLAKYVARLGKEKSWPQVVQELLQTGILNEDFVEEQLVATILRVSTYAEE